MKTISTIIVLGFIILSVVFIFFDNLTASLGWMVSATFAGLLFWTKEEVKEPDGEDFDDYE